MNDYLVYALGLFAQTLFGSRMIIQWIQSERSGHVISPIVFWQTSLMASGLLLVYGVLRHDGVIILGQLLGYFIYIRNLQLKKAWHSIALVFRVAVLLLPALVLCRIIFAGEHFMTGFAKKNDLSQPLVIAGAVGQLLLNLRFFYQWYYSEKHETSVLPFGFWLISATGALIVVIYALYRLDPVLLLAQSLGMIVYVRNMMLIRRESLRQKHA